VDDEILSDTVKIAEGTYSPLNCFYELRRTDVGFG